LAKEKLHKSDIPIDVDLFFAVANAVVNTEHMIFGYMCTGDEKYLEFAKEDRDDRAEALKELIVNDTHSKWCSLKHRTAIFYHLLEIGEKELKRGNKEKAKKFFKMAKKEYDKFWALQKIGGEIGNSKKMVSKTER